MNNDLNFDYINKLSEICILSWGELRNKDNIQKICPKIIEAQKEEWQNKGDFFKDGLDKTEEKYILLVDDRFELLEPQLYFLQCLSVFTEHKIITFIYGDFILKNRYYYMPSFKPYIGNHDSFQYDIPVFIDRVCGSLANLEIKTLSENKIGYHLPQSLFKHI